MHKLAASTTIIINYTLKLETLLFIAVPQKSYLSPSREEGGGGGLKGRVNFLIACDILHLQKGNRSKASQVRSLTAACSAR